MRPLPCCQHRMCKRPPMHVEPDPDSHDAISNVSRASSFAQRPSASESDLHLMSTRTREPMHVTFFFCFSGTAISHDGMNGWMSGWVSEWNDDGCASTHRTAPHSTTPHITAHSTRRKYPHFEIALEHDRVAFSVVCLVVLVSPHPSSWDSRKGEWVEEAHAAAATKTPTRLITSFSLPTMVLSFS